MEEVRFCICPEALVAKLIMEAVDDNEAVMVTVCELSVVSGIAFNSEVLCQQSERDCPENTHWIN